LELDEFAHERKLPLEAIEMDVSEDASVEHAIAEIERRAGPVEVLVNNAGIAIAAPMEEITLADLPKQFETNFFGVVRVTQRVLPGMRKKLAGRVINMSSIAGKVSSPLFGPYSSSKHALEAVSDALRLELYPFGIYVVLIEPGIIRTSINQNAAELSAAYIRAVDLSPYKAIYQNFTASWEKRTNAAPDTPEDCARVILRAIEETPPRARYLVTRTAKIMAFLRRILSDRAFDRLVGKNYKLDEIRDAVFARKN
jgi:NAD(P)-dependent dehydrogenase (short-subunit alcohol dehydrogenase family)